MNFTRSPNDSRAHRAVNDACRFLQNLAGLLTSHPFTITPSSGPLLHLQPILRDKKRFSITLCITASNGYLPRKPPFEIARIYQKFEPIAVGTYRHRGNGDSPSVPYWWLALRDQESLMKCKAAVDGSVVDGVVLKAVMGDEYVWEWLRPQVRQKRLETRLEKVEAFEMADLFDQLC